MWETRVQSLGWEDPLERGTATYFSILPGETHGQRTLVSYSVWGCKVSNATEQLTLLTHTHTHTKQGTKNCAGETEH